jgi:hypothetical protein
MANAITRVLTLGAFVLGIPLACFGAVLAYGKAMSDAEVAEGTLLSPEESRRRAEEFQRRFRAMTPEQHIAEAGRELDHGYNHQTRSGGNLTGAAMHLNAIDRDAGTYPEARALFDEIERRRARILDLGAVALRDALRERATVAEPEKRQARHAIACALDRLSSQGMGCVHVGDRDDTTLRFDTAGCTQAMLDRVVPVEQRAALRGIGFVRVRCANHVAEFAL